MKNSNSVKIFVFPCLFAILFFSACSKSAQNSSKNVISPYDDEFTPDAKKARILSGKITDTPEEEILKDGREAYDQGLYSAAREHFLKLIEQYPSSYYSVFSELKAADALYYKGDYPESQTSYEEFLRLHPQHEASAYVQYQVAMSHLMQYRGSIHDQTPLQLAVKAFQKLIDAYSDNEYATLAGKQIEEAEANLAEHELVVAGFYCRQNNSSAVAHRLSELRLQFPDAPVTKNAINELRKNCSVSEELVTELRNKGFTDSTPTATVSTAVDARPKMPRLLAARIIRPQFENIQRARLETISERESLVNTSRETPQTATQPYNSSNERPIDVLCEDSEGKSIFTVYLKNRAQITDRHSKNLHTNNSENKNNTKISTCVISSSTPLTLTENSAVLCNTSQITLNVEQAGSALQFNLSHQGDRKLTCFMLDRPNRLIAVVH